MSWRTLVSRSGGPTGPREYLLATTVSGLARRGAGVAAEVLADDDVDRELAPGLGDLDVLLLEDALAALVGDAGRPVLPLDLVVGVDVRAGGAGRPAEAPRAGPVGAGAVGAGKGAALRAGGCSAVRRTLPSLPGGPGR